MDKYCNKKCDLDHLFQTYLYSAQSLRLRWDLGGWSSQSHLQSLDRTRTVSQCQNCNTLSKVKFSSMHLKHVRSNGTAFLQMCNALLTSSVTGFFFSDFTSIVKNVTACVLSHSDQARRRLQFLKY